jgi:uncharacterized protein (DUF302 family)
MSFERQLQAVVVGLALLLPVAANADDDWVVKASPLPVAETAEKLTDAIEAAGASVVAVVDHRANARSAGADLPPAIVVIFGNPAIGTPLMQENLRIAIDLPQKVLIWQEDGSTMVGYVEPGVLAERYGIEADNKSIEMMEQALGKLTDATVTAE